MTQGFNFPIPRPRGTPDQQAAAMAQNLRELEVWLNKFVRTGTVIDHGGLVGLADDDHTNLLNETRHDALAADNPHSVTFAQAVTADAGTDISTAEAETLTDGSDADALHTHAVVAGGTALLADGSVDSTGTQRFTALTAILLGGTNDAQYKLREDGDSWRLDIGDNANTFVTRMRFFTGDHSSQAGDWEFRDSDGATNRFQWDQSLSLFRANATIRPETDSAVDLGVVGGAWRNLIVDKILNVAGATVYDVETSTFGEVQRFGGATIALVMGDTGDSQFEFVKGTDLWTLLAGSNADVFTDRMRFYTADHATTAHDIMLLKSTAAVALQWDNSLNMWRMFTDFRVRNAFPETDVTYALGGPSLTWLDLFVDNIKDRAGAVTYDVQNAEFDTAHRFLGSAVPFILGAAGDAQLDFEEQADGWAIRVGSNANAFTDRIILNSADHANAHDIILLDGDGTTPRAVWDESATAWLVASMRPIADGGSNLGSSNLSFFALYAFQIRDESGNVVIDTSAAGVAYTLNATAVPDRTLLASASATTLNNNNVLAALIADLQAIGILG